LLFKFQARHPQSVTTFPEQTQLPLLQMFPGVWLQFVLHPPQWTLFWRMSTHPVPQSNWFAGQAQVPLPLQVVPFAQTWPQEPQLELSLFQSRQVPLQQCPLEHCPSTWHVVALLVAIFDVQLPLTQTWLPVQAVVAELSQEPVPSHAGAIFDV